MHTCTQEWKPKASLVVLPEARLRHNCIITCTCTRFFRLHKLMRHWNPHMANDNLFRFSLRTQQPQTKQAKQQPTHIHTSTRIHVHTHVHTHEHAHMHTHTYVYKRSTHKRSVNATKNFEHNIGTHTISRKADTSTPSRRPIGFNSTFDHQRPTYPRTLPTNLNASTGAYTSIGTVNACSREKRWVRGVLGTADDSLVSVKKKGEREGWDICWRTCSLLKGTTAAIWLNLAESFFSLGKPTSSSPSTRSALLSITSSAKDGNAEAKGGRLSIAFPDRSSTWSNSKRCALAAVNFFLYVRVIYFFSTSLIFSFCFCCILPDLLLPTYQYISRAEKPGGEKKCVHALIILTY